MTRETKVGLLVGMGVILLIGIIISDHLSVVQHQDPAALTDFASRAQESINPLVEPEPAPLDTVDVGSRQPMARESVLQRMQPVPTPGELQTPPWKPVPEETTAPSPLAELPRAYSLSDNSGGEPVAEPAGQPSAVPTLTLSRRGAAGLFEPAPAAPIAGQTLAMGPAPTPTPASSLFNPPAGNAYPDATPTAAELSPPPAPSTGELIHYVAPGETLYEIAKRHYGNGDYWRVIAEHNKGRVRENGQVNQGVRLVIPNRAGLVDLGPDFIPVSREGLRPVRVDAAASGGSNAGKTIEVQSGDTLTKLASQHLGSADRWRELWDANRDQLDKPESLRVGMKLVLPGARRAAANVQPIVPRPQPHVPVSSVQGQRASGSAASGKEYVVQSGDNLSYIAEVTLGSRDRWREIYDANKDKLSSPDALVVGQKLRIP